MTLPKTHRVLITVKAYPRPSSKHGETVCVAGIDIDSGKWVRLYPVTYRSLEDEKQFGKYQIVEVTLKKSRQDDRPESMTPDMDSLKILETVDTSNKWLRRSEYVLPTISESFCDILDTQSRNNTSLGAFKPTNVAFSYSPAKNSPRSDTDQCYAQVPLFGKQLSPIEWIPFDFRYQFQCAGNASCPGHDLMIIDWEIFQAYRSWRKLYGTNDELMDKLHEKWLSTICGLTKNTYFFVGNMHRFQDTFLVLGTFYPPR